MTGGKELGDGRGIVGKAKIDKKKEDKWVKGENQEKRKNFGKFLTPWTNKMVTLTPAAYPDK